MAHSAKITALADGLVQSVTGLKQEQDGRAFKQCRDNAVRGLKAQQYARTNQFDVQSRLEGLEEKFRILNNEPLADALKERLDKLANFSSRWKPEILSSFSELSDRPSEKTKLSDLRGEEPAPEEPALTWVEIIADDPSNEEGIWDEVDFHQSSSEDEGSFSGGSFQEHTTSTQASSIVEEDSSVIARSFVVPVIDAPLADVRSAQKSSDVLDKHPTTTPDGSKPTVITESQAIRETLLMLHGLPSRLFHAESHDLIHLRNECTITGVAQSTWETAAREIAAIGSRVGMLRRWVDQGQRSRPIQRCQAAVQQSIRAFDKEISCIEQRYVDPSCDTVVSLAQVMGEINVVTRPLLELARVISEVDQDRNSRSWQSLDAFFQETCKQQLIRHYKLFDFFSRSFLDCLEVYVKPIHVWLTQGEVADHDGSFFVASSKEDVGLGSIWHDRYRLRHISGGAVDAPSFMQAIAQRIFAAGKSVMFLKASGRYESSETRDFTMPTTLASLTLGDGLANAGLSPFAETFQMSLEEWVESSHSEKADTLRTVILSDCGLRKLINTLSHSYSAQNGAIFHAFADGVFERVDRRASHWNDRFVLSELAQNTFGTLSSLQSSSISARSSSTGSERDGRSIMDLLGRIALEYPIPHSLQNITRETSPKACRRAFTLLLQVYRAKYVSSQQVSNQPPSSGSKDHKVAQALASRQRLVSFVDASYGYLAEMASRCINEVKDSSSKAADIDEMAAAYAVFTNDLSNRLSLTDNSKPMRDASVSVLEVCEFQAAAWTKLQPPATTGSANSQPQSLHPRHLLDDEDEEDARAGDLENEEQYPQQQQQRTIAESRSDYGRQISFAIAGLRSVSRAGGEQSWTMLAERLEWCTRSPND